LAGLNSMGKSSVIQSLLLLRQSRQSGALAAGRLDLSGDYLELGTGIDVLSDGAEKDEIGIAIQNEDAGNNYLWPLVFSYDRDGDRLEMTENTLFDVSGVNAPQFEPNDLNFLPFEGDFHYISADRFGPKKTSPLSESRVQSRDFGIRGEYVLHFILSHGTDLLAEGDPRAVGTETLSMSSVTDMWLQDISPGSHLSIAMIREADAAIPSFQFNRPGDVATRAFRPSNVGFGLSYVLPVIVSLVAARPYSLVMIENPEAHLHPKGQTRLGQLAVRAAAAGVQVIIETHSDHFMDGARIEIRNKTLSPSRAVFHYFQKTDGEATAVTPSIDSEGRLSDWPSGFFDQHRQNTSALIKPQRS